MKKAVFVGLGLVFCIGAPAFSQNYLLSSPASVSAPTSTHELSAHHNVVSESGVAPFGRICTN